MQSRTSDLQRNQLQRRDQSRSTSTQEQWLSGCIDDSITNFEQHQENDSEPILSGTTILSWIIGILQKYLSDHKIKAFFKPMRTIGDKLRNGKDPVHLFDRQGAVYCVPCGDCDQKYFGETKRSFNTRKKEHINYIKHFHPEKSALAKHTLELDHRMNWSKTQIAAFENDFRKRRFIESFFINSTPNVINEKSSDLFPNIYKATFGCD